MLLSLGATPATAVAAPQSYACGDVISTGSMGTAHALGYKYVTAQGVSCSTDPNLTPALLSPASQAAGYWIAQSPQVLINGVPTQKACYGTIAVVDPNGNVVSSWSGQFNQSATSNVDMYTPAFSTLGISTSTKKITTPVDLAAQAASGTTTATTYPFGLTGTQWLMILGAAAVLAYFLMAKKGGGH